MNDLSSLLEAETNGPVSADSPTNDSASDVPAFGDIVDANNKASDDLLARLVAANSGEEVPVEQPADAPEEAEETEVSEESTVEEENLADESTDDDTPVEESDDDEDFAEDYSQDEVMTYDDVAEHTFEVQWGDSKKAMTWDQIQKQLDRSRSASEKSREAKEALETLEADRSALSERESKIDQLDLSNNLVRDMIVHDNAYRVLSEQMESASGAQFKELYERREAVAEAFQTIKHNYDETQKSLYSELPSSVTDYASSKLSSQSVKAAQYDPALVELIEKAQKWDAQQKKVGKSKSKLTKKKSMQKGSVAPVPKTEDTRHTEAAKRAKKGVGTPQDADAFLKRYLESQNL